MQLQILYLSVDGGQLVYTKEAHNFLIICEHSGHLLVLICNRVIRK